MLVHLPSPWVGTCTSFVSLTCLCTSCLKRCLASTGLATDVLLRDVSQGQTSRKGSRKDRLTSRKARRLATEVSQGQACLLMPLFFRACMFIFLAFGSVIAPPSVLKPFFLPAIPEEVSRKHGSRTRRLARPDVSQQTSRKGSRKARGLATDASQGQVYLLPFFLPIFLPCLFIFLPFGSVFASFGSLTFLSTSYLKKCLASTGLGTDVSHGQTSAMTQGQTSRKRRLARTGVPTFFCSYACSSS